TNSAGLAAELVHLPDEPAGAPPQVSCRDTSPALSLRKPIQEKLLPTQLLQALQSTAPIQVFGEAPYSIDVLVQELLEARQVLFHLEPATKMLLVGEVFVGHVARIAAVRHLTDRIDA